MLSAFEKTLNADYLLTLAFEQVLQSGTRRKREEEKGEKRERGGGTPQPPPHSPSAFSLSARSFSISPVGVRSLQPGGAC